MTVALMLPLLFALAPAGQDPATILATARERQQQRWAGVTNYTVVQTVQGMQAPTYFEKMEVDGVAAFRVVPQTEWDRRGPDSVDTREMARHMATGIRLIGAAHAKEVGGPMGRHLEAMTSDMATFLQAVQHAEENDGRDDATAGVRMAAAFAGRARLAGRDTVGDRTAFVLRAEDLADVVVRSADGPAMTLERVTLFLDQEHYVPLRLVIEGRPEGAAASFTLEMREEGYTEVDGLYEPTRRVLRIGGLSEAMATDPKQRKELEKTRQSAAKARADLVRMREQMAKMPPMQQRMLKGRLEQAERQLASIADDGAFEAEIELEVIGVNAGPPLDWRPMAPVAVPPGGP